MIRGLVFLVFVAACTGGSSGNGHQWTPAECDDLASQIRVAAARDGFPDQGACNNPAALDAGFGPACENLRECEAATK